MKSFLDAKIGDIMWYYVDETGSTSYDQTNYLCKGILAAHYGNGTCDILHHKHIASTKDEPTISMAPGKLESNIPYLIKINEHHFNKMHIPRSKLGNLNYAKFTITASRALDEVVGNIFDMNISNKDGEFCQWCDTYFPMAVANQPDGSLKCWSCRNENRLKKVAK